MKKDAESSAYNNKLQVLSKLDINVNIETDKYVKVKS